MPNKNYVRSRAKEQQLVNKYRELGWYATRTPQSKTPVDVLALRPTKCGHADHFEVEFNQFKVSENRVNEKVEVRVEDIPFPANVIWRFVPIKSKEWLAKRRKIKAKKISPNSKRYSTKARSK